MKFNLFFLVILALARVNCQIDGEFWWLNKQITNIKSITPQAINYEAIGETETDKTDVIVFKESDTKRRPKKIGKVKEYKLNTPETQHKNKSLRGAKDELITSSVFNENIIFPDALHKFKKGAKSKRSTVRMLQEDIKNQLRRNTLLEKVFQDSFTRFSKNNLKKRITTPDDNLSDPYWNIKNSQHNIEYNKPTGSQEGYNVFDSVEEYSDDIPRPIYFSPNPEGDSLSNYGSSESEVTEYNPILDPRRVISYVKVKSIPKREKLSDNEDVTVSSSLGSSYQSNPNYKVFQDFKLPYGSKQKVSTHKKNLSTDKNTAINNDGSESVVVISTSSKTLNFNQKSQGNTHCGENILGDAEDTITDAIRVEYGAHPYLLLVIRNHKEDSQICHGALVHKQAAITAASCVFGAEPGEVIVQIGEWDLSGPVESDKSQQRRASILIHNSYKAGEIVHNLALLHWQRPLLLGPNVRPACLGEPRLGDTCGFAGWGGSHDNVLRSLPRVQLASVMRAQACVDVMRQSLHDVGLKGSFCASAKNEGCMSGEGGPLVCARDGRQTVVGITSWRVSCDPGSPALLTAPRSWVIRSLTALGIL